MNDQSSSKVTNDSRREFTNKMAEKIKGWPNIDLQNESDEQIAEMLNCGLELDIAFRDNINVELVRRTIVNKKE